MSVIPKGLSFNQGLLVPLILLVVFLIVPGIIVAVLPIKSGQLRGTLYGVLAIVFLYLWSKLVFSTHLFF